MIKGLFQTKYLSPFDPQGKSSRYCWILFSITALVLLLFTVVMGSFALYFAVDSGDIESWQNYFNKPLLVFLNVLPYIMVSFLVWFLSNRAWIGFFSSSVLCVAYSFTEYWKLAIRSEPLFAEDLGLVSEAIQISDGYLFFDPPMRWFVVCLVIATLLLFFFCRGQLPHIRWRVGLSCLLIIACIPLYFGVYTSKDLYNTFPAEGEKDEWIEKDAYVARGGTYPFLYSIQKAYVPSPENYSKKAAGSILASYSEDPIPEDQKVNVIFVMYEAYADLSRELGDRLVQDPYVNYHKIMNESYYGKIVTNTYGGGTITTERCVMTGFSNLSYHYRHPCWSYIRYFSDNGYVTEGSHGGHETFYNRVNVNANLGFDQYYFIENHYSELCDWYPADYIFLPEITRLSKEQIDAGNNLFSFNVTFQNHGPYSTELAEGYTEYVTKEDLSDEDYAIINNYLAGIADTDYHMMNMVDSFRSYENPVVLVFFGDHKPSLGNNGDTYNALGIPVFGNDNDDESFYNTYQTEYLIWANDAAKTKLNKSFEGEGPTISPCFLMNLLFEQCGWQGPAYMKLTDEVLLEMPVIFVKNKYLVDGELINKDELSETDKTLLNKMDQVQYYLGNDYVVK